MAKNSKTRVLYVLYSDKTCAFHQSEVKFALKRVVSYFLLVTNCEWGKIIMHGTIKGTQGFVCLFRVAEP